MTATLQEIMVALADQLSTNLIGTADPSALEGLQAEPGLIASPTPPQLDVYPATPFIDPDTFGGGVVINLTVRARVSIPDSLGAQDLLLSLMDPYADTSLAQAIRADKTLGGTVSQAVVIEGPSGYDLFKDLAQGGEHLGCTWTVAVHA